jgi:hypothetical protein
VGSQVKRELQVQLDRLGPLGIGDNPGILEQLGRLVELEQQEQKENQVRREQLVYMGIQVPQVCLVLLAGMDPKDLMASKDCQEKQELMALKEILELLEPLAHMGKQVPLV